MMEAMQQEHSTAHCTTTRRGPSSRGTREAGPRACESRFSGIRIFGFHDADYNAEAQRRRAARHPLRLRASALKPL
jgi:hypothetical protein